MDCSESRPKRISFSMSTNCWSRCRKTLVRLNVFLMISGQYCASNANLTAWLPLATGGSWKKSPVTTSCEAGCQGGGRWGLCGVVAFLLT